MEIAFGACGYLESHLDDDSKDINCLLSEVFMLDPFSSEASPRTNNCPILMALVRHE
jgi:hypothetical protein